MTIGVRSVQPEAMGFDCNTRLTYEQARGFYDAGFSFAIRYIRRAQKHVYDLATPEVFNILKTGLGLMVVQHVAPPGWLPNSDLGNYYGATASAEAKAAGIPAGVTVWLDLEGVEPGHPPRDTIEYANRWFDQVHSAGFVPGIYVGYGAELNAIQLYKNLKFQHYWAAYNLNKNQYPAVRGVQMQQAPMKAGSHIPGVSFEYDIDVVHKDKLGGLPTMLVSTE